MVRCDNETDLTLLLSVPTLTASLCTKCSGSTSPDSNARVKLWNLLLLMTLQEGSHWKADNILGTNRSSPSMGKWGKSTPLPCHILRIKQQLPTVSRDCSHWTLNSCLSFVTSSRDGKYSFASVFLHYEELSKREEKGNWPKDINLRAYMQFRTLWHSKKRGSRKRASRIRLTAQTQQTTCFWTACELRIASHFWTVEK